MLPLLNTANASAATLPNRSLAISTSVSDATGVDYEFTFDIGTTGNVGNVQIDFCTTPLGACAAPTGFSSGSATLALDEVNNSDDSMSILSQTANQVVLDRTVGSLTAGDTVEIDLANVTNATYSDPFTTVYARLATRATNGTGGAVVDDGATATAMADQVIITARVQEILEFCVGTDDADSAENCNDISGTTHDLGVLDNSTPTEDDNAAFAMVRTNAFNGVDISYFSEQDTSSGLLKVVGATCDAGQDVGTGSQTDQCINSDAAEAAIAANVEQFGMSTDTGVDADNSTTNLSIANADTGSSYATDGQYAWNKTTTPAVIATSSNATVKVIDYETVRMSFGASVNATTPTGQYTTTATFIATPTY